MFPNRTRNGIFMAALAATAILGIPQSVRAQAFRIERINPPTTMGGAKVKDINGIQTLLLQQLDAQERVIGDYYLGFSLITETYYPPESLTNRYQLVPGGLDGGNMPVGSIIGLAAAIDLWTNQVIIIHPAHYRSSCINASHRWNGAGYVRDANGNKLAAEWNIGTRTYLVLHNPIILSLGADWFTEELLGVDFANGDRNVVGWGERRNVPGHRAISRIGYRWTELHPSSFAESEALSVRDGFQVGWGRDSAGLEHALVWQGSAASAVSLNPPGYGNSRCLDIDVDGIVGYGKQGNLERATFWKRVPGNPNGFGPVDLHQFLPAGAGNSVAVGISDSGIIAGHFKWNNVWQPVLWHPIHLTGLTLSQSRILGGATATATVNLSWSAPAGGITVTVGPQLGPTLYTRVSNITIPAGASSATFTVYSNPVNRPTSASISATLGQEKVFATAIVDTLSIGF